MTETPLPSPNADTPLESAETANLLPVPDPATQARFHEQYSRRISTLTVIFGLATALVVGMLKGVHWGAGIAVGTALAWLNYRWLDQALGALVTSAAAQEGSPKAVVPLGLYAKFIGRYLLIGLTLYVIVVFFRVPILACLVGLLALGSGTIAAALYDVISGNN
jgi:hypothetical protein